MKEKRKLRFAITLASLAGSHGSSSLRGYTDDSSALHTGLHPSRRLTHSGDLQKLNRMNAERKRKNRVAEQQQDDKWKKLSKEEKKKLLDDLKQEENVTTAKTQQSQEHNGQGRGQVNAKVNGNQLAYLQQYFHQLDNGMELQSSQTVDEDVTWNDLTKSEKKRIQEMMDGELKLQNAFAGSSTEDEKDEDDLSKKEKKEQMKLEKEQAEDPNQYEDKGELIQDSASDSSYDEADEFVILNRPRPGTLTVDDIMNNHAENSGKDNGSHGSSINENEEMTQNSEHATNNGSEANDFILPMPQLTFGNGSDEIKDDEMTQNSELASSAFLSGTIDNNDAKECKTCYSFPDQLIDPSIQLDPFDPTSDLRWTMSGQGWNIVQSSPGSQDCYEGNSCIASGITTSIITHNVGEPTYSNLTLTTNDEFEGGVLIFQVLVKDGLPMPNEAFYVTVDDEMALSPISFDTLKWKECSVSVGRGEHILTWSHVYNPLGLEALPERNGEMGIRMDDLRFSPFESIKDQGFEDNKGRGFVMTSDGDAVWKVDDEDSNSGSYSIVASTSDINQESGSSNVNFVLYSEAGGTLKYKISTSTTAPHDDFVILLNDKLAEAVFGLMPTFEYKSLDVPMGKVVVTFQHRKNPGKLSGDVLGSLGTVKTTGFTRLDDVRFEPNDDER